MKDRKRSKMEGLDLPNQEKTERSGEKETFK